ncbi:MAG: 6-hydroxynicotinate reductase, partial [Caldimonas sp.]
MNEADAVYSRFDTRSDGQPTVPEEAAGGPGAEALDAGTGSVGAPLAASGRRGVPADKVRCDACPVLCQISVGKLGACDRYGNVDGVLARTDTVHLLRREGAEVIEWKSAQPGGWDGDLLDDAPVFVSGIGSGTTYPDYKPAPFIIASKHQGVDMVTVVTEGIFSYCSFKVKIDTDRYLGPEQATVRHRGEPVGHVTTIEYGSQFLSLGGVHHLTGGGKREGRISCEMMLALGNQQPVELQIEGGATLTVQAGKA